MAERIDGSLVLDCIDLSNPDIHQSASLMKKACMDSGIFYVTNHGIREEVMAEVFAQIKKLFSLPLKEKMKLMIDNNRGYTVPKKNQFVDPETNLESQAEGYGIIQEVRDGETILEKPLGVPNVWPSNDTLPGWKEIMIKYLQEVLDVGRAVSRIIAVALDLNVDFFDQPQFLGNALSYIVINHYKVGGVDPTKEPILGTPTHTDPCLITVLASDGLPGLQICKDVNTKPRIWTNVAPLKGAFIVSVGDMLERMTNCVFKSPVHRVQHRQDRYSIPYFLFPSRDAILECLPSCKSAENPAKFPPIESKELMSFIFGELRNGRVPVIDVTKY
ncbi:2-oxoglutarate (2OG) and Fe(II)-dependent oxygenase superfamily protein [Melia azedarach]|uniref:2-oxoglutarate (2OG) and Fe(II)-dependent oxygenase superfamily protein n=1 Tax=Melia azedarach TaxID=155640 RepID=A0ACC1XSY4_MELAZ|nr:2-oxoglutarate (2OG) and Fe(II)-dependent oxygenase superfamily protein [Melia azedarach]